MNGNGFKPKRRRINFADKKSDYQKPVQAPKTDSLSASALATQQGGQSGQLVKPEPSQQIAYPVFEQPVILRQSPLWSRLIVWTVLGVVGFGVTWAYLAEIEQVVPAQGQLKPQAEVKEVQAPLEGVVEAIFVKEGDVVAPGQVLMAFDSTAALAELATSRSLKKSLEEENKLYRSLIETKDANTIRKAIADLKLPSSILLLTRNREELIAENRVYQAQLGGNDTNLAANQKARLQVAKAESRSRERAAELGVVQVGRELQQNQVKIADAKATLQADRQMIGQMQQRIQEMEQRIQQMQQRIQEMQQRIQEMQQRAQQMRQRAQNEIRGKAEKLAIEEGILKKMAPIVKEGAMAVYQYDQQRLRVSEIRSEIQQIQDNDSIEQDNARIEQRNARIEQRNARIEQDNARIEQKNARIEMQEQYKQINTGQANILQLNEERQRLMANIGQSQQESINTSAVTIKDVQDSMAQNNKRIAEIDSQLIQAVLNIVVSNDKQIKELNGKILQIEKTLQDQEVTATVGGKVFDLQAYRGFVANPSETLLSIVPEDDLVAEIFITSEDIGFVREGMKTDVRFTSFPFSEFGDVKGEVIAIGSDALPPDEIHQYFRFPAKVSLNTQYLLANDRQIPLQSGMDVTINIKVRENRKVISLFTELFTDSIESLKEVR
ncbi:HlyD family efflux transporter periplasmic adaptor subunit [Spirulina sp. 06S082]|uniref:HlyD family efflux transporter periplasmic adaptor subunit n=1 Tax=Spirulina sp. 06S082 TaxID=3110248 RepID=UPI002B21BC7B|nr:HlyD family efflux transporter periplasmic adaptor subunit [Spirulina sp. 06S082]MEA5471835.1 HlyD family efflux transporter periplasmic adaptor subunit [Spirulina sp. 06S082]